MLNFLKEFLRHCIPLDPLGSANFDTAEKIVDRAFYRYRYRDVAESGMDPVVHFVRFGWKEMRDPNPYTHTRFVHRHYPEKCKTLEAFLTTVLGCVYHNALMRRPAILEEIYRAAQSNSSELLHIDCAAYALLQKDVKLRSKLTAIEHLFYDGLHQNRLRRDEFLDANLCDVLAFSNDYDFLVSQDAPLKYTSFATLDLAKQPDEADLCTESVVLGVGVILYKNSIEEITRFIRSIEANFRDSSFRCQLHIWDNSPEPLDPSILTGLCSDFHCQFSPHPENPGFAVSHNRIMRQLFEAGSTHYLGLNPDGHLLPNSLEHLIQFSKSRPSPSLIEMEAEPMSHPKWYHPLTGETEWVSGAAFLLDAEAYARTGGFDQDFPMYCEDVDLSFRAYHAGVGLYVAPSAKYYHDTSYRLYTPEPWREVRALIGAWYLCHKWGDGARADCILREIERCKNIEIEMPARPPAMSGVDPKIRSLLKKERFARSRFWDA